MGKTTPPTVHSEPISPGSWRVDFDGCASTVSGNPGITYLWKIGAEVQGPPESSCDSFFHEFPSEGTFQVTLTVVEANGEESLPLVHEVVVQDWLIVSFGDSYASGKRTPEVPNRLNLDPGFWLEKCGFVRTAFTRPTAAFEVEPD